MTTLMQINNNGFIPNGPNITAQERHDKLIKLQAQLEAGGGQPNSELVAIALQELDKTVTRNEQRPKGTALKLDRLDVFLIQVLLTAAGYRPGKIDTYWGSRTRGALLNFQGKARITTDAVLGRQTLTALTDEKPAAPVSINQPQLASLAITPSTAQLFQTWTRNHRDFTRMPNSAETIAALKVKRSLTENLAEDFAKAQRDGWSATKPLMIIREMLAFLFVPAQEGKAIDPDDPNSYILVSSRCCTGRGGFGNDRGSHATPTGLHRIYAMEPRPLNDYVSTYKGRLEGLNPRENGNSAARGIVIHGGRYQAIKNGQAASLGRPNLEPATMVLIKAQFDHFGEMYVNINSAGLPDSTLAQAAPQEPISKPL